MITAGPSSQRTSLRGIAAVLFVLLLVYAGFGRALADTAFLTSSQPVLDWPVQFIAGQRVMAAVRLSDPSIPIDLTLIGPRGGVILERHQPRGGHFLLTVPKTGLYHIHLVAAGAVGEPISVEFFLHHLSASGH
jgi:hypothetical protein